MDVRTIRIATVRRKRTNVPKKPCQLARNNIPQLKLTDSRRIHNGTAIRKRKQLGRRGRMLTLFIFSTYGLNTLIEALLQCIENGRLSNTALADNDTAFAASQYS